MLSLNIICSVICLTMLYANMVIGQSDPSQLMSEVAQSMVTLGKTIQCLADYDYLAESEKVFDSTVSGIKDNLDGPLTEDKFGILLSVIVSGTLSNLRSIDARCNSKCPRAVAVTSATASDVYQYGKSVEMSGLIMACLLTDPKPEILAQLPVVFGGALQAVATNTDASLTSTGILLKVTDTVVSGLGKLSSNCVAVKESC